MYNNVSSWLVPSRCFGVSLLLAGMALCCGSTVYAQTITTADYLYIGVEAEDYTFKDDRWVRTDSSTGTNADDPDGNHSDGASGGVYFEILPDVRVTHDDLMGPPTAYWGEAGTGPEMHWPVTFPEPGRYHVHIRAYSTGTEDNGIHVGVNGGWPGSGNRMQWCTAGLGWSWSSAQRNSGGNGPCGAEKTIYFDITNSGPHTVAVSAREDGFELDRLVFIKDLSNNTKTCSPTNETTVNCKAGGIEVEDGFINLKTALETTTSAAFLEQSVNVSLTLENLDGYDTATNVEVRIPLGLDWEVEDSPSDCSVVGTDLVCSKASLAPTAPDEHELFELVLKPLSSGNVELVATASADETDNEPVNDAATLQFIVAEVEVPETTDVTVSVETYETVAVVDVPFTAVLTAVNSGDSTAIGVTLAVDLPDGVDIFSMDPECESGDPIVCQIGDIEANSFSTVEIKFISSTASVYALPVVVAAANDSQLSNNDSLGSIVVSATSIPGVDGGDSGDNGSSGGGSVSRWLVLMLGLLLLTRLYGRHQRKLIAIRD